MTRLAAPVGTARRLFALLAVPAALAVAAVALAAEPAAAPAADDPAAVALDKKILATAKEKSELLKNLTYMSDVIGPRLTGSANLKRANDWTADVMKSYGLENVRLEPWEIPVGWERGTATLRLVEPDNGKSLTVAAMAWTPGTKGKVTGDVVVVRAQKTEDLAQYKGKLKNAIVLSRPPSEVRPISEPTPIPGERRPGNDPSRPAGPPAKKDEPAGRPMAEQPMRPDRGGFGAQGMAFRRELNEFLRTEGAAVILSDSGKPHGLLNMTGNWRGTDRTAAATAEPLPTLFIVHEHYAMLYRLATRPGGEKTRAEVEVTNKFVPGPVTVYNTVGEIRGSEKPDEVIVVGAHLDSWDLGQGTTDNGTGSCAVLETARILMKCGVAPKRTIRFVLFTGEEQGLHGSRAYCARHKDELAKTSMALVHDTGTGKVIGLGTQGRESVMKVLEKELVTLKEVGFTGVNTRSLSGTDHQAFEAVNVPGFACRQDMGEYRLTHHSQSDTLDKAKEADLIQGAQVMAVTAMRVANLPEMLPRDKPANAGRPRFGERQPEPKAGDPKPPEKKDEKPVEKKGG